MSKLLKLIVSLLLVGCFIALSVTYITAQDKQIKVKSIEIKSLNSELKELDSKYNSLNDKLETTKKEKSLNESKSRDLEKQRDELEAEKKRLEAELHAKRSNKLDNAAVAVVNRATGTATASASSGDIIGIITNAANKYGVDPAHAIKIARCESTLNPLAQNRSYSENGRDFPSGLYQHLTNYWPNRAAKYGYAGASVFDPVANANVTMAMFADGHSNLWECR